MAGNPLQIEEICANGGNQLVIPGTASSDRNGTWSTTLHNVYDNVLVDAAGATTRTRSPSPRTILLGGSSNDKLTGGSGDDRLYGGSGSDVMAGDAASVRSAPHIR